MLHDVNIYKYIPQEIRDLVCEDKTHECTVESGNSF